MRGDLRHSAFFVAGHILLVIALAVRCPAQQSNPRFDHITSAQGLSDNYVLCSLQDRYGFIWFGTRDGLNKYDGYRFTIYRYDAESPGSLSDGSVNCIFEDHQGELWVGTHSRGLNRLDRIGNRFLHYEYSPDDPRSIPGGRVTSICEDDDHYLWVTTGGPGPRLARLDPSRRSFTRFAHDRSDPRSLSSDAVTSVARDGLGNIWVSTADGGINRYDPATGSFINGATLPGYSFASLGLVSRIIPDAGAGIWLFSGTSLHSLDARSGATTDLTSGRLAWMVRNVVGTIFRDRSGVLWFGTMLGGLAAIGDRPDSIFHYTRNICDPYALGSNRVFCITEDRAGNLWFGTDDGISKLDRRSRYFQHYQYDPFDPLTLSQSHIRSILEDSHGDLWVGTSEGGLDRFRAGGSGFEHYLSIPGDRHSLSENTVNVLYEDRNGDLWAGTNYGLDRYDRRTGRFIRYLHDPADRSSIRLGGVWSILEDSRGDMWIGQLAAGLSRLDRRTGAFTYFPHDPADSNSVIDDNILCLFEDRDGNIWIGTDNGASIWNRATGRFAWLHHDPHRPGTLSNDRVWYIHQDGKGAFWIGTSGGGLNRYDPVTGAVTTYTEREGLAHNIVCGILEDRHGYLWISTNRGISRFDPVTGGFHNRSSEDGLHISEFHFKTCFLNREGTMYFGGTDGVIRFNPDSIRGSDYTPAVALTSFRIFDQEMRLDTTIELKRQIRLGRGSNFFSLEFAALDLTNPLANRYRYTLEGFDAGWRETDGSRPYASYTNVPPGRYRFRVRGSNSDGVWNREETVLSIVIEPAFWQTWWFQGAMALAAIGLVGMVGFIRIRTIKRRSEIERHMVEYRLKALRAQMNPHFIFNSLNSILSFIINHDADSAHTYLSKFSRLIRFTLENSINESIALADEIESIRFYLELESLRFDDVFVYEISIDPAIDPRGVQVPPMLIQPYAENAIKYGLAYRRSPGRLLIEIREGSGEIICSIVDNGVGREQAARMTALHPNAHKSRGMQMTRERLEVLNSLTRSRFSVEVIDLHDDDGVPAGTRIDIHIPITMARPLIATTHHQEP